MHLPRSERDANKVHLYRCHAAIGLGEWYGDQKEGIGRCRITGSMHS